MTAFHGTALHSSACQNDGVQLVHQEPAFLFNWHVHGKKSPFFLAIPDRLNRLSMPGPYYGVLQLFEREPKR
jgi:hypothetical protein